MSSCHKYVFWKISAIVLIVFVGILIKYLGKLLDLVLEKAGSYTTAAWFIAFAVSLGLGAYLQRSYNIRNMWKSPFASK